MGCVYLFYAFLIALWWLFTEAEICTE